MKRDQLIPAPTSHQAPASLERHNAHWTYAALATALATGLLPAQQAYAKPIPFNATSMTTPDNVTRDNICAQPENFVQLPKDGGTRTSSPSDRPEEYPAILRLVGSAPIVLTPPPRLIRPSLLSYSRARLEVSGKPNEFSKISSLRIHTCMSFFAEGAYRASYNMPTVSSRRFTKAELMSKSVFGRAGMQVITALVRPATVRCTRDARSYWTVYTAVRGEIRLDDDALTYATPVTVKPSPNASIRC